MTALNYLKGCIFNVYYKKMFNSEILMCYHVSRHQIQILPSNINRIISWEVNIFSDSVVLAKWVESGLLPTWHKLQKDLELASNSASLVNQTQASEAKLLKLHL